MSKWDYRPHGLVLTPDRAAILAAVRSDRRWSPVAELDHVTLIDREPRAIPEPSEGRKPGVPRSDYLAAQAARREATERAVRDAIAAITADGGDPTTLAVSEAVGLDRSHIGRVMARLRARDGVNG